MHQLEPIARPDESARDAALQSLLIRYPEAPVVAIDPGGKRVQMPSSVPLIGHHSIEVSSSMSFAVPTDQKAVVDAFHRADSQGAATVAIHLAKDPERTVTLHYVDVRERHGVFVVVVADYTGDNDLHAIVVPEAEVPRFCRTTKSGSSVFLDIDDATTKILGWTRDQMVGRRSLEFIHPDDQGRSIDSWMEMVSAPGASGRSRLRHRCRDGSWRWMEISNRNLMDDPDLGCVVAEMVDISDEMAALEALRAREQLLDRLAEALPLGVFQVDTDRRVIYTNSRFHQIIGVSSASTIDVRMEHIAPADRPLFRQALEAVLDAGVDGDIEVRLEPAGDRRRRLCTMSLRALTTDAGQVSGAIVCVADVTESAEMRDELQRHATFDALTGCHNRRSIMSALEAVLGCRAEAWPGAAVIFVDIDRFKPVNDRLGHAAGDELLTVVAGRLRETVRSDDIVGRIGGDEFLVVCPRVRAAEEAMRLGHRIADVLACDITIAEETVALRASVGVAWTRAVDVDADTLVGDADAAMYASKRQDEGSPVLFDSSLRKKAS